MTTPRPEASVLVVDDEQEIRRLMSAILGRYVTRYRIHVTEAATAEEALAALELADFDLIVSDYSMPGKTGIDLLAVAHKRAPRTGRVLITALEQLDIGVEAINRGKVDGFLRKPWDNAALVALVDSLLETRIAPAAPAPGPQANAQPAADADALEREKDDIDKQLGQLRVRLGLGNISPEGYRRIAEDLAKRRAQVEVALLKLRATSR